MTAEPDPKFLRALSVLRDVARAPQDERTSWAELRARGHRHATVRHCVARGWLRPIALHAPRPYHFTLTDEGTTLV